MYKLESSVKLLHYILTNDYPSWSITAIDDALANTSGTYSKYDIIGQFKLYNDIDALCYDFSLDIDFDSIDFNQWHDEICLALCDYLVAYNDGMYLVNLGEQY